MYWQGGKGKRTYLDVDRANILVDTRDPEKWVDVALGVDDRQSLRTPEMRKQPLNPVTSALDRLCLQRGETNHIRGPIYKIAVLETRCVAAHFDRVGVSFGGKDVDAFG